MTLKAIHPFPARMASEIAISHMHDMQAGSTILDPMVGSGTVLRTALSMGHKAIGCDVDPLSVLISTVSVTPVEINEAKESIGKVVLQAKKYKITKLNWIDDDTETKNFVDYWFHPDQQGPLRRLSRAVFDMAGVIPEEHLNIARVCISKLIVTKDSGASLARDVSHSRPHRTRTENNFDVFAAFERAVARLLSIIESNDAKGKFQVYRSDARRLLEVKSGRVDAVITSPPYLNAIDYMRGHRLALVWLGFDLKELRTVRSTSTGADRALEVGRIDDLAEQVVDAFGDLTALGSRHYGFVRRYAYDLLATVGQSARVLRQDGRAIFVIGDSCVRTTFVKNSDAIVKAGALCGMKLIERVEREIPASSRYLPTSNDNSNFLSKRMRNEVVLKFTKQH